jgi:multicomponent Na+:H+ antiporter subunit C
MPELLIAAVVGVLYAAGLFLMMDRDMIRLVIGLSLLGNAANLLIFTAAGLTRGGVPLVSDGVRAADQADPLPQALILTAIVIGFGVQAFALVLIYRARIAADSDDLDELRATDR